MEESAEEPCNNNMPGDVHEMHSTKTAEVEENAPSPSILDTDKPDKGSVADGIQEMPSVPQAANKDVLSVGIPADGDPGVS